MLGNAPLASVEEVRYLGTALAPDSYILDKGEGTIIMLNSIVTTRFAFEVDYTHGFATVPQDLALSALEFVTHLHKREFTKSRNLGNGEQADYGDPELMPTQVRLGLNMYRLL